MSREACLGHRPLSSKTFSDLSDFSDPFGIRFRAVTPAQVRPSIRMPRGVITAGGFLKRNRTFVV